LKPKRIMVSSPSEFNATITLERPSTVPDGMGGETQTWVVQATVRAIVNDFQSDEMVLAMQSTGVSIRKIRVWYRTDIKNSWRIGYAGKYWQIIGLPSDLNQQHRFLDFRVKEFA